MPDDKAILAALKTFAHAVTAKMNTLSAGAPEDQLRGPFENFMQDVGKALVLDVVCTGETPLPGRLGRPDYAVHAAKLLAGHVELKAPGVGANPKHFKKGHNRDQWKRFKAIPNLIYTDGNEWGLYQSGERVRPLVRLAGDVSTDGKKAIGEKDAAAVLSLLTDFLRWQPIIPTNAKGKIDLKTFAKMLAPLCGMLRGDVTDALEDPQSPLVKLAGNWRELLFPDASDEEFADAYAQTVTFALLLARSNGADLHPAVGKPEGQALFNAEKALVAEHSMLSKALQVLTDPNAQKEISASLRLLMRIIGMVPPAALKSPKDAWLLRYEDSLPIAAPEDPWLFFYEDFLSAYDPKLRKDAGAYYTPVEVVLAQVRLVDDLLTDRLGKALGFADPGVVTLDPAAGTGTYLLAVIDHALARVHAEQGKGAVPGKATALANNIYGFENMAGPFAVSELRVTHTLLDWGAKLPAEGPRVYLTDTLESPHATPSQMGLWYEDIAKEHERALHVKANVPVIVCLGNPPYDRHEAVDPADASLSKCGGWVRFGDALTEGTVKGKGKKARPANRTRRQVLARREKNSILYKAFIEPVKFAGHGGHLKNAYNLYVYFWRWALWKVFESKTSVGPGVVSYISASSYIDGDAFCGMRKHMRRVCDEVWILDLGGEGRGTRKTDNVFAIQTPVAIAVAVRQGKADEDTPAKVHYARIEGSRTEKLKALNTITGFASLTWQDCPEDWLAPFRPAGAGAYHDWPSLIDLLPWQHSGVQLKRIWPIAPNEKTLQLRWRALLLEGNRSEAFHGTGDREVDGTYRVALTDKADSKPISQLPSNAPVPPIMRYAYRSLDRQYIIADGRLMSRPRPDLWAAHGDGQVYLTSLLTKPLGTGPALTACAGMPDLDHFSGRGAKDVAPLYRDAQGKEANILPGLLALLAKAYCRAVMPEELLAYVYGALAQPAFTDRFAEELGTRKLRVPLTKDGALFERVRDAGAKLLWLHTYGQRFVPKGKHTGRVPKGAAKCKKAVPGDADNYPETYEYNEATKTLHVGAGEFAPVAQEVYEFEVSGLEVVQSWLGYRMKRPKGKRSSPLDEINPEIWPSEFTTELLELLWVLEATVAEYPAQAKLLERVVSGECFAADELPDVPEAMRKPPKRQKQKGLFDEG